MKLTATIKGLITGVLMILVSLFLFYGLKKAHNDQSQMAVIMIYIVGIVWSLLSFRKRYTGEQTFKAYFTEGFRTFIVATLVMVIYTAVFFKLNPQILEAVIKENEAMVNAIGDKTPAEIAENSAKLRSIFMPMTISMTTVTYLLFGAVTSVIGGLFLRKTAPAQ